MKYFTKEELEDISRTLIENPTHETLQKLNEKYNGSIESSPLIATIPMVEQSAIEENLLAQQENNKLGKENETLLEIKPVETPMSSPAETIANPISNENMPNIEVSKMENTLANNNVLNNEIPGFELPKLETPTSNTENNSPINFTGNLFDTQVSVPNMMQTTDNFNSVPNTMQTTEVPITGTPFFGPHIVTENNPIPVENSVNAMPSSQPSMFGQIEQNYM